MLRIKFLFALILVLFFSTSINLCAQIIKDDFRVNDDTVGGYTSYPDVEMLENGEAIVVWQDGRNGRYNIYGQVYDSLGDSTGANFKVSSRDGSNGEYEPAIAPFGDSLIVVWEYGSAQWLLSDGSLSGTAFGLGGTKYNLDVAISDSGFFVVWDQSVSGSGQEVFLQGYDFDGDSIMPRIVLNDDGGSEDQRYASIAMSNDGSFVVFWVDERNPSNDIYGQLVDPSGDTIGGNFMINDDGADYGQYLPSCAMDFEGNFVVVWYDYRDGNSRIYGQRFDTAGSPIDSNFMITAGTFQSTTPTCAMDSSGNFVVVWYDNSDSDYNIYGQIFDNNGDSLGAQFRIDQDTLSVSDNIPKVSMNENNFFVTWNRNVNEAVDVYKRSFENDGTPLGDEVKVNDTEGTNNQTHISIDMNIAGDVAVVWYDDRNPAGMYFQHLDTLGNSIGNNILIGNAYYPEVGLLEDSRFIVTYDAYNNIYYKRFNITGDSIGSSVVISDTNYFTRTAPVLDLDAENNAVVAWYDQRLGNSDIYAQIVDSAGDTIGDNFKVSDDSGTTNQVYPAIAVGSSGNFLVVWHDFRNGDADIYGQVYDSGRNPVGSNILINADGTTANQFYPDAASLPDGNFVAVWQDYRSGARGIYGQIIDSMGNFVDTNFRISDATSYVASVSVAPTGAFVVTWVYDNDIYAQAYYPDLSPYSAAFKVNNETEGPNTVQENPVVATNGSKAIMAWEDPKWQKGLDVAAKIYSWDQSGIEDISKEGKGLNILGISSTLLTGKEWLTISVDTPAAVDFKIINVAGMVVSSKILKYTNPGIKGVDFDVSKLPCGPYFLSIETDSGRAVKKAVVIK